jgi:hypothetical protein
VTSPDDERDRVRDLDDITSTPVADRPAPVSPSEVGGAALPGSEGGPSSGAGDIPTASPPSHTMPGTAEELAPVDGVFAPEGDEPAV